MILFLPPDDDLDTVAAPDFFRDEAEILFTFLHLFLSLFLVSFLELRLMKSFGKWGRSFSFAYGIENFCLIRSPSGIRHCRFSNLFVHTPSSSETCCAKSSVINFGEFPACF